MKTIAQQIAETFNNDSTCLYNPTLDCYFIKTVVESYVGREVGEGDAYVIFTFADGSKIRTFLSDDDEPMWALESA